MIKLLRSSRLFGYFNAFHNNGDVFFTVVVACRFLKNTPNCLIFFDLTMRIGACLTYIQQLEFMMRNGKLKFKLLVASYIY